MSRPGSALRSLRRRLFDGLLGVPVLYILGGAAAGALMAPLAALVQGVPDMATVEIARRVLPTIGGATLSLAGFVLTITTLALQFGASTYAPRLVDRLRRDPLLRHTLGTSLGTFTYSVVVLLVLRSASSTAAALAAVVAVAGSTATVLLFIALLERLIGSLRPGRVLAQLTSAALGLAETAYPEENDGGEAEDGPGELPDVAVVDQDALGATGTVRRVGPSGHLLDVHVPTIVDAARRDGALVLLTLPVGTFLQREEVVAVVQDGGTGRPRPVDGELEACVLDALEVGDERTAEADPSFPLRLVVDAGLRALSPGVNDPSTAAQAVEHVEQILLVLSRRRLGTRTFRDADGVPRLRLPAPGWDALVDLGYTELLAAGEDPQSRRALARSLARLGTRVAPHRRPAVERLADRAAG
ncbi:DUF2254 family protein [Actinotalea sp.]|uniref:DUF2254 family protein n=1 Tax=Actinotalea sp. TaxID=1872145 RepID=UPI00356A35BE